MNLQQYTQGALLTESKIEAATVFDYPQFKNIIDVIINANRLLDLYKKNIYYGKQINYETWRLAVGELAIATVALEQDAFGNPRPAHPKTLAVDPRILHGIIGISTEASELLEAIEPHLGKINHDEQLDHVNLGEEVGDISWYIAILLDAIRRDWEQELSKNADKLEARNRGKKFDAAATINRNVEQERQILEGSTPKQGNESDDINFGESDGC